MTEDQIAHHLQYSDNMFKSYQTLTKTTVLENIKGKESYFFVGLSSEVGEVNDIFKKVLRDRDGVMSTEDYKNLFKELGDVLWYVAGIANLYNMDLGEIARGNIEKLLDRKDRGKLHGSGDNR